MDSVSGRDTGNHRARLQNLPIYGGPKPVLLATDRHGACGNAHTSCRVGHELPRSAYQFGDSSKDVCRALAVFARVLTTPLGERPPCIRQRPAHDAEVIAPTSGMTIICVATVQTRPQRAS